MKTLQLFTSAGSKSPSRNDKWLTDETYYRAIKAHFPTVESLGFHRGKMNRAISTHGGNTLGDFTNQIILVVKQDASIPLAISKGMYGDTMILLQ